jgi:hypothetical protein
LWQATVDESLSDANPAVVVGAVRLSLLVVNNLDANAAARRRAALGAPSPARQQRAVEAAPRARPADRKRRQASPHLVGGELERPNELVGPQEIQPDLDSRGPRLAAVPDEQIEVDLGGRCGAVPHDAWPLQKIPRNPVWRRRVGLRVHCEYMLGILGHFLDTVRNKFTGDRFSPIPFYL